MIDTLAAAPALDQRLPPVSEADPAREHASRRATTIEFIDVDFTAIETCDVIAALRTRDPDAPFAYVVTPNVDHVVRLQRSRSDLWPVYRGAWMTLCDSRVLAKMARRIGLALPVLPGSDLTVRMFGEVIQSDDRIAIVGGCASEVEALARRFGLQDVHHYDPPMGFIRDPLEVAQAIRFVIGARARYVFLAVGSPQQEVLAHCIGRTGATGIGLCVGASLDFLTGAQDRAPEAMQRFAVEWLYRLATNPRRLSRRYLVDGPEIFQMARRWNTRAR